MMSPSTVRRAENGRLVWYGDPADAAYWDHLWLAQSSEHTYASAEKGNLGYFEGVFTRYLPRSGRILEAGCGLARLVLALRVRGYDVEGVEWAQETVQLVKEAQPQIPVRVGDVTHLDVPDGWYAAYISLGVVEHLRGGPEPFLREAWRVLEPGGVALISVPYYSPLRRAKALLGFYGQPHAGLSFYQYAFAEREFDGFLRQAGFRVVDHYRYDRVRGFADELPLLPWVYRRRGIGWRLRRFVSRSQWLEQHFGHMTMAICRKPT